MVYQESPLKPYTPVFQKSICLVISISVVGSLGCCIPNSQIAYAAEEQACVRSQSILITDPYIIILELIDDSSKSVVTVDDLRAFLSTHNISSDAFLSITKTHLSTFSSEVAEEVTRLQSLLKSGNIENATSLAPVASNSMAEVASNTANNVANSPTDSTPINNAALEESTSWAQEEAAIEVLLSDPNIASNAIVYPQWNYSGNTTFTVNPQASISHSALIALLGEHVRDMCQEKGMYASVILAQIIQDANSYDCKFTPFQNKVFLSKDQQVDDQELKQLNAGYDTSKRFKNRFASCADMVEYLEDYTDALSGEIPYVNHYLNAAQTIFNQDEVVQAELAEAQANQDIVFGKADLIETPREYANFSNNSVDIDTSASDLTDIRVELTQEQIDEAYLASLDSIPATYQEACYWLEANYDCDEGYALSLLQTIDQYDLTRYDQMRSYRLKTAIKMPVKDGAGNIVIDEQTGQPVMEELSLVNLMDEVISHLGDPYVWGGTTPGAFDCSGLVQYAYSKALGISIPRTTYYQCLQGEDVDFQDLQMGDLVFFADSDGACTHVGIYLGEGCYIEAPQTGDVVKVTSMVNKKPTFAKRILSTENISYTFTATKIANNQDPADEVIVDTDDTDDSLISDDIWVFYDKLVSLVANIED